jgi:hypothetical protein
MMSVAVDDSVEWLDRTFLERYRGDPRFFGDPDGGRADLDDFIDVAEIRRSAFFSPDSGRVRVVIGRKGSGKTLYLRRLAAEIRDNPSTFYAGADYVIVDESEQTHLLNSEQVIRVAHLSNEISLTEVWQQLWGRAIVTAAATQVLYQERLKRYVLETERSALLQDFASLIGRKTKAPRSPFTTLKHLIDRVSSPVGLSKQLNDPLWDDLENRVADLLERCPPLYFVIDTVDEDFAHAPSYWARCQKGLFYETMRLLRNRRLGSRLHVVISIRDMVYHAVFRSEHASRYVGDPHLRILHWTTEAATALLDAKDRRIPAALRPKGDVGSLAEWLGFHTVTNAFGIKEEVQSYALRHTQCLPRDIVSLGNLLGAAMDASYARGAQFTEANFREVVSDVATLSGHVQLGVAANQVIADEIPLEASRHGFVDAYLSIKEYREDRIDKLKSIISACRRLRFGRESFLSLQAAGRRHFGAPDLGSILWQVGLLGVELEEGPYPIFFSFDRLGRLKIPEPAAEYVFHPSMREVAGLQRGDRPVTWSPVKG